MLDIWERSTNSYLDSLAAYYQRVSDGSQPSTPFINIFNIEQQNIILCVANSFYMIVTMVLFYLMRKKQSGFRLRWVLLVYDAINVLLGFYIAFSAIFYKVVHVPQIVCNPLANNPEGYRIARVFVLFYLQKYFEYFDTWFFILRKSSKQVTFLHLFHHSSITIVVGSILPFDYNGDMYLPIMLNSINHMMIYLHYLLATLGIQSYWAPYITSMQLLQFILIFLQSSYSYYQGPQCGSPDFAKVLMIVYMGSMVALFGNFVLQKYIFRSVPSLMMDTHGVIKRPAQSYFHTSTQHYGTEQLDKTGACVVMLPEAFPDIDERTIAASFRIVYSLTPVGDSMPSLHVSREVGRYPEHDIEAREQQRYRDHHPVIKGEEDGTAAHTKELANSSPQRKRRSAGTTRLATDSKESYNYQSQQHSQPQQQQQRDHRDDIIYSCFWPEGVRSRKPSNIQSIAASDNANLPHPVSTQVEELADEEFLSSPLHADAKIRRIRAEKGKSVSLVYNLDDISRIRTGKGGFAHRSTQSGNIIRSASCNDVPTLLTPSVPNDRLIDGPIPLLGTISQITDYSQGLLSDSLRVASASSTTLSGLLSNFTADDEREEGKGNGSENDFGIDVDDFFICRPRSDKPSDIAGSDEKITVSATEAATKETAGSCLDVTDAVKKTDSLDRTPQAILSRKARNSVRHVPRPEEEVSASSSVRSGPVKGRLSGRHKKLFAMGGRREVPPEDASSESGSRARWKETTPGHDDHEAGGTGAGAGGKSSKEGSAEAMAITAGKGCATKPRLSFRISGGTPNGKVSWMIVTVPMKSNGKELLSFKSVFEDWRALS